MSDVFSKIKNLVDIKAAAERYGMTFDRYGKTRCIFHDGDSHPSLSVDPRRGVFCCFSCGAKGDTIRLVQKLTGDPRPIDVCRRLNADFNLNISDLEDNARLTGAEKQRIQQRAAERERERAEREYFRRLCNRAEEILTTYHRQLWQWRRQYQPKDPEEPIDPRYIQAIKGLSRAEFLCDMFLERNNIELTQYFQNGGVKEVKKIAESLRIE